LLLLLLLDMLGRLLLLRLLRVEACSSAHRPRGKAQRQSSAARRRRAVHGRGAHVARGCFVDRKASIMMLKVEICLLLVLLQSITRGKRGAIAGRTLCDNSAAINALIASTLAQLCM
jgi:hypothetical protein